MTIKQPTEAERLYMMLADALWSALGTDSAETVRNRVLHEVNDATRAEVEALIEERRKLYAQPVEESE